MSAERIVAAARGAVGARFRAQGRDPAWGLDCLGLAALALRAGGFAGDVPSAYAMRGGDAARIGALIDRAGLTRVAVARAGDLMLFETGPAQFHLGIAVPDGLVHADAMLRRVVERPGTPPWPIAGMWRIEGD